MALWFHALKKAAPGLQAHHLESQGFQAVPRPCCRVLGKDIHLIRKALEAGE